MAAGGECGVPFWQRFFMPTGPIKWVDAQSQRRSPEWYSFDHGPVHFLQMSTEVCPCLAQMHKQPPVLALLRSRSCSGVCTVSHMYTLNMLLTPSLTVGRLCARVSSVCVRVSPLSTSWDWSACKIIPCHRISAAM